MLLGSLNGYMILGSVASEGVMAAQGHLFGSKEATFVQAGKDLILEGAKTWEKGEVICFVPLRY